MKSVCPVLSACAVLLLSIFWLGGPRDALAQSITAVDVEGNQRIEAETVRSYLGLRIGSQYDPASANEALKRLYATGLFADVSVRLQGDRVIVAVIENPIINQLAFEGNRRIKDDLLGAEVQLRPRTVYTRSRLQADVQRLIQVYRRSGRFAAAIDPKVIQLDQNRVDLVFEINEGSLTGIRRIDFVGNQAFSDNRLHRVLSTKETRWYRFLTGGDSYDPDRLTLDRELLRKFYLERGYADFRVVSAVAELSRNREDFFITFTVEEGSVYSFGDISINSQLKDITPDQLQEHITTIEGEIYNAEKIEDTIQNLTFALGELGYAFVDVRPRVKRDRDNLTIDLSFEINEGPRVYVERINITGNVRTLDRVIRREFRLAEGDAFNTAKIRRSRQRIRGLGFFDKVDIQRKRGSAPDRAVLDVDVQERSTGEISFGAGFSTTESVVGDVSITERNLLGKGQTLSAAVTVSNRRQQFDISFTEPYFLERNIAAGFDLFKVDRDFQRRSSFDESSVGFTLRSSFELLEHLSLAFRYSLREDDISDISDTSSVFIRREEGETITSSIGYTLTYDLRDDRFEPRSGYLLRLSQDLAGLGGDVNFLRSSMRSAYYHPISEIFTGVVALNAGYVQGLNERIRVTDRFFLGGDSFRGFEAGGVGPRDSTTDDSIGGNLFYVGTAELRFPLPFAEEFGITGRTFIEAGALTDPDVTGPSLQDTSNLRVAGGFGMSWRSPFGLIRLDFATPFIDEDFDQREAFRFSFGTGF